MGVVGDIYFGVVDYVVVIVFLGCGLDGGYIWFGVWFGDGNCIYYFVGNGGF